MATDGAGPDGSELSDGLGLAEEARACARHCKEGAWSPNVLQNEHGVRLKSAQVLEAAAAEIERLHRLLKEPTRGTVFAGWFSELPSGMTYRLWQQGGHDPGPGEVPLYV